MTTINERSYELLMSVLRTSQHPSAPSAIKDLKVAHMESMTRALEFNNEAPALLRAQA